MTGIKYMRRGALGEVIFLLIVVGILAVVGFGVTAYWKKGSKNLDKISGNQVSVGFYSDDAKLNAYAKNYGYKIATPDKETVDEKGALYIITKGDTVDKFYNDLIDGNAAKRYVLVNKEALGRFATFASVGFNDAANFNYSDAAVDVRNALKDVAPIVPYVTALSADAGLQNPDDASGVSIAPLVSDANDNVFIYTTNGKTTWIEIANLTADNTNVQNIIKKFIVAIANQ